MQPFFCFECPSPKHECCFFVMKTFSVFGITNLRGDSCCQAEENENVQKLLKGSFEWSYCMYMITLAATYGKETNMHLEMSRLSSKTQKRMQQ